MVGAILIALFLWYVAIPLTFAGIVWLFAKIVWLFSPSPTIKLPGEK